MKKVLAYWSVGMGIFIFGLGIFSFIYPPRILISTPLTGKVVAFLLVVYGSYRFFYGYRVLKQFQRKD